jgi:hypothetical protein
LEPRKKSDKPAVVKVREELWAIPSTIPMLAYIVRPVGDGTFPLLVMNHGVSLDPKERSYFPRSSSARGLQQIAFSRPFVLLRQRCITPGKRRVFNTSAAEF